VDNRIIPSFSRRRLIQFGTASAGAAVVGASFIVPAHAQPTAVGGDGAPAGDPRFEKQFAASLASADVTTVTSYNGWPIGTPGSTIGVETYIIPGTSISLAVKSGDVATVLIYLAKRFNAEVETLRAGQVDGYEYRYNVNNPSVWSNHASGTAIDLNYILHPNTVKGTFTAGQLVALRNILAYCGPVIYWGGDYSRTTDEMHYEINVPPGDSQLAALASEIRKAAGLPPVVSLRARADNMYVTAEKRGSEALIANRAAIGPWEQFDLISRGGDTVALRAHANNLYVCAERAGSAPLIANRAAIGPWETFTKIRNSDGTVALRAAANGRYVTAERAGALSLIANRTAIGPWETFDLLGA
jgi:hypothetical protein